MTTIYDDLNTAISMCREGSDIHDLLVAVSDALLRAEADNTKLRTMLKAWSHFDDEAIDIALQEGK